MAVASSRTQSKYSTSVRVDNVTAIPFAITRTNWINFSAEGPLKKYLQSITDPEFVLTNKKLRLTVRTTEQGFPEGPLVVAWNPGQTEVSDASGLSFFNILTLELLHSIEG